MILSIFFTLNDCNMACESLSLSTILMSGLRVLQNGLALGFNIQDFATTRELFGVFIRILRTIRQAKRSIVAVIVSNIISKLFVIIEFVI